MWKALRVQGHSKANPILQYLICADDFNSGSLYSMNAPGANADAVQAGERSRSRPTATPVKLARFTQRGSQEHDFVPLFATDRNSGTSSSSVNVNRFW